MTMTNDDRSAILRLCSVSATVLLGIAVVARAAEEPPVLSWQDTSAHVGEEVVVEGTVVDVENRGGTVHLRFSQEDDGFVVVLVRALLIRIPEPVATYAGEKVRVRGTIRRFRDRTEMLLRDPRRLQIVRSKPTPQPQPESEPTGIRGRLDAMEKRLQRIENRIDALEAR